MPVGVFEGLGATTLPAPPPTLASFIGQIPASLNIFYGWANDGKTQTGQFTDFTQWDNNTRVTVNTGQPSFDGTSNCQTIVPTTAGGTHFASLNQRAPQVFATPNTFRFAVVAKPNGYSRIVLSMDSFNFANSTATFGFDLAGGNTNYDQTIGANITVVGGIAHIQLLSGGFYLCYFDYFFNSNNALSTGTGMNLEPFIFIDNGSGTGARSTSFTGDGTSGVNILIASLLPTPLWSFNSTPALFDDFLNLSSIDLTNSKAPGFNWYINNLFPNTTYTTFGWAHNPPSAPTPTANITRPAESLVQLYSPNDQPGSTAGFGTLFFSTVDNGAGGLNGTANSFGGSQVREMYVSFSSGLQSEFNQGWSGNPAFVGYSQEAFTATGLNSLNNFRFMEWDIFESQPNVTQTRAGSTTIHEWRGGSSVAGSTLRGLNQFWNFFSPFVAMELGTFARITGVWINTFQDPNAIGWGAFYHFNNGLCYQINDYALNETGAGFENHHPCLNISSNELNTPFGPVMPNQPPGGQIMQVDWVAVYLPTSPATIFNYCDFFDKGTDITLDVTGTIVNNTSGANFEAIRSGATSGKTSGKWYWEIKVTGAGIAATTGVILGLMNQAASTAGTAFPGSSARGAGLQYNTAANTNINGVTGDYTGVLTWVANDVIGFAFDAGAGQVWIHKNGTYIHGTPGSAAPNDVWSGLTSGNGPWYAAVGVQSTTATATVNFGTTAFAFTVPTGYTGWTA